MASLKKSEACITCHEMAVMVKGKHRFERCEDCRRADTIRRWRVRKVRYALRDEVGKLISYNVGDGWRAGYLMNIGPNAASVQPIGSINGPAPDIIRVSLADMKLESCQSLKYPRVEDYYAMTDKAKKRLPVLIAQPTVQKRTVSTEREQPKIVDSEHRCPNTDKEKGLCDCETCTRERETLMESPTTSAGHNSTIERKSHHAPIDMVEAQRLYLIGTRMSAIIEAVRGNRAAGGCANDVRKHLRAAGVYKEPEKK